MKSIIISILMLMSASAISAQSTYLKISLAKNYTEAANILKTSIDTLNNKERAKCYNALVYKNNKVLNAICREYSFKEWGIPNRFSELLSESIPTLVQTCKDALSCAEYDTLKSATTRLYDTEAKIICIVSKKGAQCIECHHKDI